MTQAKKAVVLSLLPSFKMTKQDIEALNSLPDNLPDTKLTGKQRDLVDSLYSKYIRANRVTYGWGNDLYELEQKEKWPSAGRVKMHEAKRMLLDWLANYSTYYSELTGKKAAEFLMNELTCREADRILISKAYQIK